MFTEEERTEIYKEYSPKVMGYLVGKTCDAQLSEDICSDVFVKVFAKLDSFNPEKASISTWIYHITRNTLYDHYRTHKTFVDLEDAPDVTDQKESVEESICREESLKELANALESMDERLKDLIVLHYYGGHTLKEVAARMGISYSYAKVLHVNALKELKKKLK